MKSISLLPLVVLASLLFVSQEATAASLFGKVIEVNDGDTITIFNLNRPVKVRLLAVDAPESNQPFGDVAKEHLRRLVFDKFVSVEYTGLGEKSSLIGKVLFEGMDVGAQMIRDGAAWFDPNKKDQLSESDCEIYLLSEQAARGEKRGLWQDEGPIPPWEYAKTGRSQREAIASPVRSTASNRDNRRTTSLTNESLLGNLPSAFSATSSDSTPTQPKKPWQRFEPTGESFSVLVPVDGRQIKDPIPSGDQMVNVNYYMARDGASTYAIMWATGPSKGEADLPAIYATLQGFLRGVSASYANVGKKFACEPTSEIDISSNGFQGREFNMPGCTVPAMARLFTRAVGNQREMYLGVVLSMSPDPNAARFIQSFTVSSPASLKARTQSNSREVRTP